MFSLWETRFFGGCNITKPQSLDVFCGVMWTFYQVYQQDATIYNILYYCQCSTCFRRFLRPSSGAQNCTHSTWYMSSLLAATASGGSKQAWHISGAVCTVLSSWWWVEKPPETRRALTVIKNIVYRCILLVYLTEYINDTRSHERQMIWTCLTKYFLWPICHWGFGSKLGLDGSPHQGINHYCWPLFISTMRIFKSSFFFSSVTRRLWNLTSSPFRNCLSGFRNRAV